MRRIVYLLISVLVFQLITVAMPALHHTHTATAFQPFSFQSFSSNNHKPVQSAALVAQGTRAEPSTESPNSFSEIISTTKSTQFDVNDISFLWPVPENSQEANALITAAEKTADGSTQIWPKSAFDTVIETAQTVGVEDSAGNTQTINFNDGNLQTTFDQPKTWKVVGMRIDPSAPGSSSHTINQRGSVPQIRLIMQPVTLNRGQVIVHDYTAHLVYNFTKGDSRPAVPDTEKFAEIVNDLKRIKANLAASGISTDGKPLGVHPGFRQRNDQRFRQELKTFITKHLSGETLSGVSFMGLNPPEPWIFFAMAKVNGSLVKAPLPTLGSNQAQMLIFLGDKIVIPEPDADNLGADKGVSTAMLFDANFDANVRGKLASPVFDNQARPRFREIPDIIANPERSHFFNTDCVSCHSESARRETLPIRTGDALFKYPLPEGISGVDPAFLPTDRWNVRNFGWFPSFFSTTATVTERTANETAEAAEFINQQYLINTPVNNAVAKDNGIGGANLRRRPLPLSALKQNEFCVLRPGQSVGIDKVEPAENGFVKVDVAIPNTACPSFRGETFLFQKHFDLAPITKTVAKRVTINGVEGAHLRRRPLQLSKLTEEESCLLKPNQSIGVNAVQAARDGFTKVNVIVPSPTCPAFKGNVFVFNKHFNFD